VAQSFYFSWQDPSGLDEAVNVGMYRGTKLCSVITLSVGTTTDLLLTEFQPTIYCAALYHHAALYLSRRQPTIPTDYPLSTIHCTAADYLLPCTLSEPTEFQLTIHYASLYLSRTISCPVHFLNQLNSNSLSTIHYASLYLSRTISYPAHFLNQLNSNSLSNIRYASLYLSRPQWTFC
jgi:hypothetical protein